MMLLNLAEDFLREKSFVELTKLGFKFITIFSYGFRTMDFVFSNDNPYFLINNLTTVEKLGHRVTD